MSKSSRVASYPPTWISLMTYRAPSSTGRRSADAVTLAPDPVCATILVARACAWASRSALTSCSARSRSPLSSGEVHRSVTTLRVNSTLPAPMNATLTTSAVSHFVQLRARVRINGVGISTEGLTSGPKAGAMICETSGAPRPQEATHVLASRSLTSRVAAHDTGFEDAPVTFGVEAAPGWHAAVSLAPSSRRQRHWCVVHTVAGQPPGGAESLGATACAHARAPARSGR